MAGPRGVYVGGRSGGRPCWKCGRIDVSLLVGAVDVVYIRGRGGLMFSDQLGWGLSTALDRSGCRRGFLSCGR